MSRHFKSIQVIADIEGSSGCLSRDASSFMTEAWFRACVEMTRDVNVVVTALFAAGVERITVHDFHRTGYNLLPERIDPRARVFSGYRQGPVPGIGDPGDAEAVMFLGMHAASGTDGFLSHTLTSRIKRLEVNGRPLAEVELFSGSLASYGVRPLFFSGCPVACAQATQAISNIDVYPIDKTVGPRRFDGDAWRRGLAGAAVASLDNISTAPYNPRGPLKAVITMRDGEGPARTLARRWGFRCDGPHVFIRASDIRGLYDDLIRLCYLTPLVEKIAPFMLFWYRLKGRVALEIVRRQVRRKHLLG